MSTWDELQKLRAYCDTNLKLLGSGAWRRTYANGDWVLKLPWYWREEYMRMQPAYIRDALNCNEREYLLTSRLREEGFEVARTGLECVEGIPILHMERVKPITVDEAIDHGLIPAMEHDYFFKSRKSPVPGFNVRDSYDLQDWCRKHQIFWSLDGWQKGLTKDGRLVQYDLGND